MNNPRLFLWAALGLILFVNYETWMKDYGAKPEAVVSSAKAPALDAAAPQAGVEGAAATTAASSTWRRRAGRSRSCRPAPVRS